MTVGEIVPDTDETPNDWQATGSPHYDEVNEDHSSPSDGSNIFAEELNGDDNDNEDFGFTTLTDIVANSITQVKVWTRGIRRGSVNPTVAVSWNGGASFSAPDVLILGNLVYGWASNTWAGLTYSKADLDQFQIRYTADVPDKENENTISCVYVEVTYTSSLTGYTNIFVGVIPANIGKISGVATANIAKVKGV